MHLNQLDSPITLRHVLRTIPLFLIAPVFTLLASIHAGLTAQLGPLVLVGLLPAWASGGLSFCLLRQRRPWRYDLAPAKEQVMVLAQSSRLLAFLDAFLLLGFAGGMAAGIVSIVKGEGGSEHFVTGTLAVGILFAGVVVHGIFVAVLLCECGRRVFYSLFACPICNSWQGRENKARNWRWGDYEFHEAMLGEEDAVARNSEEVEEQGQKGKEQDT